MNLTELFTPAAIAANWNEVYSNRIPYLGEGLFPARKKAGLDLSWFKGTKGLPISLMPAAFDAQTTFRDRIGLEKLETEMPFFREGFKIKESDRQELLRIQESSDPYAAAIIARLYDDANELIEGADVVAERMRMQLLFPVGGNLGISIKANGVDYTYDYDPAVGGVKHWKTNNYTALSGNTLWTATTTADPFSDIETVQNAIRSNTGADLTTVVMNSTTFNLLAKIDAVKKRFLSTAGITTGYITRGDVQRVFADTNGIQFLIYDKMFRTEAGNTAGSKVATKFVPDGYVALMPSGPLGNTWYGTTPEEADGAAAPMSVSIVNTGVAVKQITETDPVNVNTIASEIVLPSYERADEVALLKVTA